MRRDRRAKRRPTPAAAKASEPAAEDPRVWLWFRNEACGRLIAREELEALPTKPRSGLSNKIARVIAGEARRGDVARIGGGLFEVRYELDNNHYRAAFFYWGRHWVCVNVFFKNQEQTPKPDLERCKKRKAKWIELFGKEPPAGDP